MDRIIETEREVMKAIAASSGDSPILMINQNRYLEENFPDGELYKRWRSVNKRMIDSVGGKILWTLPVQGQIMVNGNIETLDEILAYWYPSNAAFLDMVSSPDRLENFEIRKELIDFAIIHRCPGANPPLLSGLTTDQ